MKTWLFFLFALFISFNGISQIVEWNNPNNYTKVKSTSHGQSVYFLDTSQSNNIINVQEYYKSNVLLLKHAVYPGYTNYVLEQGAFRYDISTGVVPEGYGFYINLDNWDSYLKKNKPDYYSNVRKYKSLAESSKKIYRDSFEDKLYELQVKESKEPGRYSFERAVIVSYLTILNSDYTRPDTGINYDNYENSLNANSDDWYKKIEEYNLISQIEETIRIKESGDIDQIVDLNEKLNKEHEALVEYKELYIYYTQNKPPMSIEEYDSAVLKMKKEYPGKFTNQERLMNDRENHIKKINQYEQGSNKFYEVAQNGHFNDLDFKLRKVDILRNILSEDDNGKALIELLNIYQNKPKAYMWKGNLLTLLSS